MTPAEALDELRGRVEYLIDHARAPHPLGVVGYTPAAFGEAYKALYLRDFTYMAESASELIPLDDIRKILALFVSKISREGLCPERIANTGEIHYICHGPRPAADCSMFLAKLAMAYLNAGGDAKLVEKIYPDLARTLATAPTDPATGLVYIDPASPSTAYGFTDTIAITGHHLFCSLLLLEAANILARLAKKFARAGDASQFAEQAARIQENLDRLWSESDNLFFAGSKDCHQLDVWGSAYACAVNAVSKDRRQKIATTLLKNRGGFLLRGQVRHLRLPENWQKLILNDPETQPGRFQNGAYWGTATGWMSEAFEVAERGAGVALLVDLVADFREHGIWECIGPGGYQRIANNISSACLPYASFKRLLKPGIEKSKKT